MKGFNVYIDESGMFDPKTYKLSPVFTICGLVLKDQSKDKLLEDISALKQKYFKNKDYIFHNLKLISRLNKQGKLTQFSADLSKIASGNPFFLFYVCFDKEKCFKRNFQKETILKKGYYEIVGSLIKFLIAKEVKGKIFAEASSPEQDIILYKALFTYIANGIPKNAITSNDVKEHLTSLSFVTKLNNDPEEQLADLLSVGAKFELEIKSGKYLYTDLNDYNQTLLKIMRTKLFKGDAQSMKKRTLYQSIEPFKIFP